MADNTSLNPGVGGDSIRDISKGGVKTQVVTLDMGGSGAESLVAGFMPVRANIGLPAYDYFALTQAATTDTYTYKTGGAAGTLVATVTITYTDNTKAIISTVAKT